MEQIDMTKNVIIGDINEKVDGFEIDENELDNKTKDKDGCDDNDIQISYLPCFFYVEDNNPIVSTIPTAVDSSGNITVLVNNSLVYDYVSAYIKKNILKILN